MSVRAEISSVCLLKCVMLFMGACSCPVRPISSACASSGNREDINQPSPLLGSPGGRLVVDHIVEKALEEADIYQQHRVVGSQLWSAATY